MVPSARTAELWSLRTMLRLSSETWLISWFGMLSGNLDLSNVVGSVSYLSISEVSNLRLALISCMVTAQMLTSDCAQSL